MSYPPPGQDPNNPYGQNPYGQQQPQQNPYAQNPYGQQQPQQPQPGYGYPQQQANPYAQQPQAAPNPYGQQPAQPAYGYPQQQAPQPGMGYYPGGRPQLAHWGLRVGGMLLDGLIILVPYLILGGIGSATGDPTIAVILGVIGWLITVGLGLWIIHQEGTTGQTPGKKAVGIKLVREDNGQYLGFGMAFVRRLAHFLDSLACYIGWLWPLWDEKNQTFADKVCSTVVIRAQ